MTPKEKANEIVKKMFHNLNVKIDINRVNEAKQCALIAVDEILSLMIKFHNRHIEDNSNEIIFWECVKEEIEKL
jgi:hypothetical protein